MKFLNFFFRQIRRTRLSDVQGLDEDARSEIASVYPYVSPCGKELNFIRPAAKPIVFHSLNNGIELVYGGNLVQPLDFSRMRASKQTGRLYHQLVTKGGISKAQKTALHDQSGSPNYGLIRSSVAVSLSERIVDSSDEEGGEMAIIMPEGQYPLQWLPDDAEPGPWALPLGGE